MVSVRIMKRLIRVNEVYVVGGTAQTMIYVAFQALPTVHRPIIGLHSENRKRFLIKSAQSDRPEIIHSFAFYSE